MDFNTGRSWYSLLLIVAASSLMISGSGFEYAKNSQSFIDMNVALKIRAEAAPVEIRVE